jgi:hypothetical protein
MARKDSARYQSLNAPDPNNMRIPDVALLHNKKELRAVLEIVKVARDNLLGILEGPTGGGGVSQALGKLELRLLEMMNPGQIVDPPGTPPIVAEVRLGYVIGTMENGSGVAHVNQSEVHYTTAMSIISSELSRVRQSTAMSEFATECGYVLARSSDKALDTLIEIAEQNAEKLRPQSQPRHAAPGPMVRWDSTSPARHARP